MPADFAFWLLDETRQKGKAAPPENPEDAMPEWKVNRDGSKTMRVTTLDALYAVLPRNPNLKDASDNR